MALETPDQPIPLTILTGFLGAGKTTLLNRILHADHGLRVAVMVNDFGSINIDSQLIVGVEGEAISLANGCICCTIRGDLLNTALGLLGRREPPEYLIIEASGVSDPWAVAETFGMPELRPYFALDGVITVVDAEYVRQNPHYEGLIIDQVSAADIVVLSKIDLVEPEHRAAVEAWVREIVPRARILPAIHGEVPFQLLLGIGRYTITLEPMLQPVPAHHEHGPDCDHDHDHHHDHDHDHHHDHGPDCDHDHDHHHDHGTAFSSWSYTSVRPMSIRALRRMLMDLPEAVFRAKGLIYLAEAPARRAVLQAVGPRISLTLAEPWGEAAPQNQVVCLSAPGQLDTAALQVAFDGCLTDLPAEVAVPAQQSWLRGVTA